MDFQLNISSLIIEVTRRCNLYCEHCLRGDAQNMDIDLSAVDALLSKVDYVSCLTLTGGEPTLNIPAIKEILEIFKRNAVDLGNIYLVTNGLVNQKDLAMVLVEYFDYCSENEITGVAISHGFFHGTYIDDIKSPLKYFTFFRDEKPDPDYEHVIKQGRGVDCGYKEHKVNDIFLEKYDDIIHIDGDLYLNCKGDLIPDCDLSYDEQENHIITNVFRKNWFDELVDLS